VKAYVLVKVQAGQVREVVRKLKSVEGITEASATLGPYDVVAVVDTTDVAKLGVITASAIQTIPGVERTLTCLAVEL
jgi:DNA-binding Lrp family transcriptional regulator